MAAKARCRRSRRSSARSVEIGVDEIVIGMPHRGRLNVLANIMGKPYPAIFSEFQGGAVTDDVLGSGDVKYHLGTSTDRELPDGGTVHLSLTANPSHLEAVNPVVLGKVRAKQTQKRDTERARVMGLLLHGDAAFAGQGVVHEGLEMSELRGFRTGGTIHLIVNNQIGFTTSPAYARSSPYPSDVARSVQAPIFHVNGDDPEAVVHVARLAAEFRQRFKKDVVIDLWCYRRHGHNEGDEPSFTQPLMYRTIAQHPTTRQIYARRLIEEGVVSEDEAQALIRRFPGADERGARGRGRLQDEQGRLAGGRLERPDPRARAVRARQHRGAARAAARGRPRDDHGARERAPAPQARADHRRAPREHRERRRASTGRPPSTWRSARCCARASRCA